MFFRVLGAMVVADAIDRRARRRPPVPTALGTQDESQAISRRPSGMTPQQPPTGGGSSDWNRAAPERPL
jgi:hypothetical protein